MIVNKVTTGYVIQRFNTDTKKFLDQDFTAGDEVRYENDENGESVDPFIDEDDLEAYLPFDMKQPEVGKWREEVGHLVEQAEEKNIDPAYLDESVHESFALEASTVNNAGLGSQIEALYQHLGKEEVEKLLNI